MNSIFITYYTEPPLLSDNLHHVVTEEKVPDHNQNVEISCGQISKWILKKGMKRMIWSVLYTMQTVIASRSELPKFDTKKEFTVKWNFGAQSKKKYWKLFKKKN